MSAFADRASQSENCAKPFINVTPLIDVLLVMLIIFMSLDVASRMGSCERVATVFWLF